MASRPSTTPNINTRVETAIPMARFSICEDDEEAPLTVKRPRFSQPASQSQRSCQRSQSRVWLGEEFHTISVEDVESDSQEYEEEEDDEDDEAEDEEVEDEDEEEEEVREDVGSEDNAAVHGEAEPVSVGQNQQQQTSSANVPSSTTASPEFNHSSAPLQVVLADPDVLDCPICLDSLFTPVFQCENGHIACSSCCSKINRKCPSCCMPIGYNRCRAIEKVLESVMVECKNARYGCITLTPYAKRSEHEQMCPHALCFCPHPSCHLAASSKHLYLHFGMHHSASSTRFTFNTTFSVELATNERYLFLQEQHESVIFVLNHQVKEYGRAFSVDCVGPRTFKNPFIYQLTAKNMEGTLSLQCVPGMHTKWRENTTLNKNYLLVPSDFSGSSGILSLQVCIKKALSPV